MNKVIFSSKEGTLTLYVPGAASEAILMSIYKKCLIAYQAWLDTDAEDSAFVELPQYIVMCLNDENIYIRQWDFTEN